VSGSPTRAAQSHAQRTAKLDGRLPRLAAAGACPSTTHRGGAAERGGGRCAGGAGRGAEPVGLGATALVLAAGAAVRGVGSCRMPRHTGGLLHVEQHPRHAASWAAAVSKEQSPLPSPLGGDHAGAWTIYDINQRTQYDSYQCGTHAILFAHLILALTADGPSNIAPLNRSILTINRRPEQTDNPTQLLVALREDLEDLKPEGPGTLRTEYNEPARTLTPKHI
jgi:hypothetical protein